MNNLKTRLSFLKSLTQIELEEYYLKKNDN